MDLLFWQIWFSHTWAFLPNACDWIRQWEIVFPDGGTPPETLLSEILSCKKSCLSTRIYLFQVQNSLSLNLNLRNFLRFFIFLRVDIFEIFCLAYLSLQTLFFQKLCIFLVYGKMDMLKKMTLSFLWKRDECIFWEFFIKFTDWNAISHSEQKRRKKCICKKSVNLAPFFYLENFVFLVKKSLTKNS